MARRGKEVFILGAGFSRAISPTMPLLAEMGSGVLRVVGKSVRMPPHLVQLMGRDFSHALSYLEQEKPWLTAADNLRDRALFLDMSLAIARHLEQAVEDAGRHLRSRIPGWLATLIRYWHEQRCIVVTLNYDTLIETAMRQVRPEGRDVIATREIYPLVLTDAAARAGGAANEIRRDSFRLLKLHGSTNWFYSGRPAAQGESIFFVPPIDWQAPSEQQKRAHAQRLRAVADKYPFLVPPIYDKSPLLTHETIRALWFEASEALHAATRVICMGYSLPESDLTMRHFLLTSCRPKSVFEIVNASSDAGESFQRLFRGTGIKTRQSITGTACISRAVERL